MLRNIKERLKQAGRNIVMDAMSKYFAQNNNIMPKSMETSEPIGFCEQLQKDVENNREFYRKKVSESFCSIDEEKERILYETLKRLYYKKGNEEDLPEIDKKDMMDNHLYGHLNELRNDIVPWIESLFPLKGAKVLEIGCGTGVSTLAFGEQGALITAIDVDETHIEIAKKRCELFNVKATFMKLNAMQLSEIKDEFDFVIYARAIEHLTYNEKLSSIRASYNLLKENGHIIIYDAPNRLWFYDSHTSLIPFFHWLPDELAIDYAKYTPRTYFNDAFKNDADDSERLARWGRGVSFHEFELALNQVGALKVSSFRNKFLGYPLSDFSRYLKTIGPEGIDDWFYGDVLSFAIKKQTHSLESFENQFDTDVLFDVDIFTVSESNQSQVKFGGWFFINPGGAEEFYELTDAALLLINRTTQKCFSFNLIIWKSPDVLKWFAKEKNIYGTKFRVSSNADIRYIPDGNYEVWAYIADTIGNKRYVSLSRELTKYNNQISVLNNRSR